MKKVLLIILKNLLAFVAGAVVGIAATLIFAEQILRFGIREDVGLGIIAVAPAILIIYGALLGLAGGILGIILYNVIRWLRKRKTTS